MGIRREIVERRGTLRLRRVNQVVLAEVKLREQSILRRR